MRNFEFDKMTRATRIRRLQSFGFNQNRKTVKMGTSLLLLLVTLIDYTANIPVFVVLGQILCENYVIG